MPVDKLAGVHPDLVVAIQRVLAATAALGFPMLVTDGVRTTAQQQALYAQGRTAPGKIVTRADGVRNKSNHQAKADGLGRALDCTFLVDGDDPDVLVDDPVWWDTLPWAMYGECAKAVGLKWGGDWPNPDRPHVELP